MGSSSKKKHKKHKDREHKSSHHSRSSRDPGTQQQPQQFPVNVTDTLYGGPPFEESASYQQFDASTPCYAVNGTADNPVGNTPYYDDSFVNQYSNNDDDNNYDDQQSLRIVLKVPHTPIQSGHDGNSGHQTEMVQQDMYNNGESSLLPPVMYNSHQTSDCLYQTDVSCMQQEDYGANMYIETHDQNQMLSGSDPYYSMAQPNANVIGHSLPGTLPQISPASSCLSVPLLTSTSKEKKSKKSKKSSKKSKHKKHSHSKHHRHHRSKHRHSEKHSSNHHADSSLEKSFNQTELDTSIQNGHTTSHFDNTSAQPNDCVSQQPWSDCLSTPFPVNSLSSIEMVSSPSSLQQPCTIDQHSQAQYSNKPKQLFSPGKQYQPEAHRVDLSHEWSDHSDVDYTKVLSPSDPITESNDLKLKFSKANSSCFYESNFSNQSHHSDSATSSYDGTYTQFGANNTAFEPSWGTPPYNHSVSMSAHSESKQPVTSSHLSKPETKPVKQSSKKRNFPQLLMNLWRQLDKKDTHKFFANPVSDLIAPGYSTLIKHPIDLSTIKEKIVHNQDNCYYTTLGDFHADIKLMCDNAMTYNQPDTIYYKSANQMWHFIRTKLFKKDALASYGRNYPLVSQKQLSMTVEANKLGSLPQNHDSTSIDSNGHFPSTSNTLCAPGFVLASDMTQAMDTKPNTRLFDFSTENDNQLPECDLEESSKLK